MTQNGCFLTSDQHSPLFWTVYFWSLSRFGHLAFPSVLEILKILVGVIVWNVEINKTLDTAIKLMLCLVFSSSNTLTADLEIL